MAIRHYNEANIRRLEQRHYESSCQGKLRHATRELAMTALESLLTDRHSKAVARKVRRNRGVTVYACRFDMHGSFHPDNPVHWHVGHTPPEYE